MFDNYIFRSHMVGHLISVPKPLTERQSETLIAYRDRAKGIGRPLTEKQEQDWHSLEHKENESKKYSLTSTAQNICTQLVFDKKYNRKSKLKNKYFEKGTVVEKKSRDLMSAVLGVLLTKDEERKTNEWVTGKRDIENDDLVFDIKSTWSYDTFNRHLLESANDVYLRQLDCYMELWGIPSSMLCYVLVDTPSNLIEDEIRRAAWNGGILDIYNDSDENIKIIKSIVEDHIFTEEGLDEFCHQSASIKREWFDDFVFIPQKDRIHMIPHEFDKIRIEQRNECLKLAREYMNTVTPVNNLIAA